MALTAINGPATVTNPQNAKAVRNPQYDQYGNIIASGSTPGATDLSFAPQPSNPGTPSTPIAGGGTNPGNPVGVGANAQGQRRDVVKQFSKMNRADPRQGMSLTAEELRQAALSRLRGQ